MDTAVFKVVQLATTGRHVSKACRCAEGMMHTAVICTAATTMSARRAGGKGAATNGVELL